MPKLLSSRHAFINFLRAELMRLNIRLDENVQPVKLFKSD
jgi:hypothetical protein